MADDPRTGVLLVNLGTPDAPETRAVRRYLREFLSDPRVIDLHPLARWALVNLIIVPFRSPRSAEAYAKVWTADGSPLLVHGRALRDGVARALGPPFVVELAMRYGRPSLAAACARLDEAGCNDVVVVPLYPQYAASSTGSTLECVYREAARRWNTPFLAVVPPFHDAPGFVEASARVAAPALAAFAPDHVLFSFHGLPERHVRRSDPSGGHCLRAADCCARIGETNRSCYRAQCHATARAIATRLGLAPERTSVAFQSRLGRTPWIRPYTDVVLPELARRGVRRLAVLCPSFVADCLETLEEIGLRAAETFRGAGGEALHLVPCVNAHPTFVECVAGWCAEAARVRRRAGDETAPSICTG